MNKSSQKPEERRRILWRVSGCGVVLSLLWLFRSTLCAQEPNFRDLPGQFAVEPPLAHHSGPHHPMPLDQYIALLEDPQRDEWQKPDAVMQALKLQDGQVVADIGAGSGYFTLRLARAVGPKGTVLALDVDEGMLNYLRQRLAKENLQNVKVTKVSPHDPLLNANSLDLVFVCDVYHHFEEREAYLQKLRKALKPAGRLVIVDFYQRETPVGPPLAMRLSEETVEKELQSAGLHVTEKLTSLPYQYILIAQPTTKTSTEGP